MARPATIHYQRVNFSLPKKIIELLESNAKKNKRSEFVAQAIAEKIQRENEEEDIETYFKNFHKNFKVIKGPSSLELLRKMRYEI